MIEAPLIVALKRAMSGSPVQLPEGGRPIWQAFLDLSATRTLHQLGPNPISYAEIRAYAELMSLPLGPQHVAQIRELDAAWLAHVRGKSGGAEEIPADKRQPLTAGLFDAMFG